MPTGRAFQLVKHYVNNSLHLAQKCTRIFVCVHYLFQEANSFQREYLRKTVCIEEQIMSKDKYPSIFSRPNRGCCVYYLSNIFRNMQSYEK